MEPTTNAKRVRFCGRPETCPGTCCMAWFVEQIGKELDLLSSGNSGDDKSRNWSINCEPRGGFSITAYVNNQRWVPSQLEELIEAEVCTISKHWKPLKIAVHLPAALNGYLGHLSSTAQLLACEPGVFKQTDSRLKVRFIFGFRFLLSP